MKKIILCIISVICVCAGFVFGFYYCKNQIMKSDKQSSNKELERVAIVNLDEGVQVEGETVVYSSRLLNFASDYVFVGLNEAQNGMEADMYAAYIVIPSDFSQSVESINSIPNKAQVEYILNPNLTSENRLVVQERLDTFRELLNSNVAYLYLSSVLREFHSIQDSANTILQHDQVDLDSVLSINPDDIFNMIDFSEMKETDNNIDNVDLAEYINTNSNEVNNILSEINDGVEKGEQEYQNVAQEYTVVSGEIGKVQTAISEYNPLKDENGNDVYETGLENLDNAIDVYSSNVDDGAEEGVKILKEEMGEICSEYASSVLDKAQQYTDERLEEIQNANKTIVESKIQSWEKQQDIYYRRLTDYSVNVEEYLDIKNGEAYAMQSQINQTGADLVTMLKTMDETDFTQEKVCQQVQNYVDTVNLVIGGIIEGVPVFEISAYEGLPDYQEDLILLPEVEKLYEAPFDDGETMEGINVTEGVVVTDTVEESEEIESTDGTISINVDEKIDIESEIPEFVNRQEETLERLLNEAKSEVIIDKTHIKNIIDDEIVGVITEENTKEINNYTEVTSDLLSSMQMYDSKMMAFNPYNYIDKKNIATYQSAIAQNVTSLETSMNDKNTEYLEFINTLYQNTNDNITTLQTDMQTANDVSKAELNQVLTELKTNKQNISNEDEEILGTFVDKLPYTRLGSLEYAEMQRFMVTPVEVRNESVERKAGNMTDSNHVDLEYSKLMIVVVCIVLLMLVIAMIIKLKESRKELRLLEDE